MEKMINLKNIRELLVEGFSENELRRLCFLNPEFRDLDSDLPNHVGKATLIDMILAYAERRKIFNDLLSWAKQENPKRYDFHQPYFNIKEHPINSDIEQSKIVILFLTANPSDTARLQVDKEFREIDTALRQADHGNSFILHQHMATRVTDLQNVLLRYQPDIVHFSGHGDPSGKIILTTDANTSAVVPEAALNSLFSILKDKIRCVFLNACYTDHQAKAIAKSIDCVVGMSHRITDTAAIAFASSFYQALGFGRDVKTAFDLGCIAIEFLSLQEHDKPKLLSENGPPSEICFRVFAN